MGAFIDMTGQIFCRLTVLKRIGTRNNNPLWLCSCECGMETTTTSRDLKTGNTRSCGCIHKDQLARRNIKNAIHGDEGSRLYGVWHAMKQRCHDANRKDFPRYGGRGIVVCKEWDQSYSAFREWALTSGYDPNAKYGKCTLDRVDVNGPYSPSNCRWVDAKAQANNRAKPQKQKEVPSHGSHNFARSN